MSPSHPSEWKIESFREGESHQIKDTYSREPVTCRIYAWVAHAGHWALAAKDVPFMGSAYPGARSLSHWLDTTAGEEALRQNYYSDTFMVVPMDDSHWTGQYKIEKRQAEPPPPPPVETYIVELKELQHAKSD